MNFSFSSGSKWNMVPTHPTTATTKHLPSFWAYTKYNDEELHFTWTIGNFSLRQEENGIKIRSPVLTSDNGLTWALDLYPKGHTVSEKGYVSIYLHFCSSSNLAICPEVKFEFTILNALQNVVYFNSTYKKNSLYYKFKSQGEGHGWPQFVKTDELFGFLKDDVLTICCKFAIIGGTRIDTSGWSNNASREHILPVPECTLSNDIGSSFKDQNSGDTIIQVDDKEFRVYKGILQARSPVFAAMFQHEMKELTKNRVIITDFEPGVVEEMLIYIYTGKAPNLQAMANDLLSIADKYNLERLKMMSADVLSRKLTSENAIDTLILAELYKVNELKTFVMNFIVTNCCFLDAAAWEKIVTSLSSRHPNLIAEVITAFASKK